MSATAVKPTRAERVRQCRELRDQGLVMREIGERLELATSTVHAYLNDPDGSRAHERKMRGRCVDCGTAIRADQPGRGNPVRCAPCAAEASRVWTCERIAEAIQTWAAEHDGEPPYANDWNTSARDRRYPSVRSVRNVFGTWNAAISAAGFEPRRVGRPARAAS